MTLSRVGINGPAAAVSGTLNVAWTIVPASGDLVVLHVQAVAGQTLPASIAGWTTMFTNGTGGGYVSAMYTKVGTGAETGNQAVLTATQSTLAWMSIIRSDLQTPAVTGTFGADSSNAGNGITCTSPTVATATGNWVESATVWALTNPSFPTVPTAPTGRNITQTGATFGTLQNRAASTWQTNHRYNLSDRPVTAGATGALTYVSDGTTANLQGITNFAIYTDTQPTGSTVTPPAAVVPITVPIPSVAVSVTIEVPTLVLPITLLAPTVTGTTTVIPPAPPELCSAVYDPTLGRVRITAGPMPAGTRANVERSVDGINWTPVRGGTGVVLTAGSTMTPPVTGMFLLPPVDDYEFVTGTGLPRGKYCDPNDPSIENIYRITPYTPPGLPNIASSCTDTITPGINEVWLKSIYRPFLNKPVQILRTWNDVTRSARGGVFPIVGRSLPIAVSDVRGSREWTFSVCVGDADAATSLDLMMASGDPLFLHVPNNSNLPVPSMHIYIQDSSVKKVAWTDARTLTLPIVECAAPGTDVTGSSSTWQTVVDTYTDWQAVINANDSWLDLLDLVASESEIIVP